MACKKALNTAGSLLTTIGGKLLYVATPFDEYFFEDCAAQSFNDNSKNQYFAITQFGGLVKCYAFRDVPDAQPNGSCAACPLALLAQNKCGGTTFASFYDIFQVLPPSNQPPGGDAPPSR